MKGRSVTDPRENKSGATTGMDDLFITLLLHGGSAALQAIAAAGLDVNVADSEGRTLVMLAVHYAARCSGAQKTRIMAAITCLLANGADVDLRDEIGQSALSRAITLRQKAIAKLLIEQGGDLRSTIN